MIEDMAQVHISEAELARDVHAVIEKVRQGAEVVVERNHQPLAVLRAAEPKRRKLSEIMASLSEQSTAAIDEDFAADVEAFIDRHREPLRTPEWD